MPTTALSLARRLFGRPRVGTPARRDLRARPSLLALEARDVPALYLVSLAAGESGAGTKGDAGAEHSGSFTASPAYVEAATPAGAVELGLSGSLTVTLPWSPADTKTYAMGVGQVGVSQGEYRPFLLVPVADDHYQLQAEDLAGISYCDWDYNDRSYELTVQKVETVGGVMWTDANSDGIQTADEPVMPGLTVQLMKGGVADGSPATTGSDGAYSFTFARNSAAVYAVQFARPTGSRFTDALQGTDYAVDSDADEGGMSLPLTFPSPRNAFISAALAAEPAVTATFATKLIPINANTDNVTNEVDRWKSAEQPGVPKVRDFEVNDRAFPKADEELVPVTITVTGGLPGTVTVEMVAPPEAFFGHVRFWADDKKAAAFASKQILAGQAPFIIFAEGFQRSNSQDDVTVITKFQVGVAAGNLIYTDEDAVTVTPVVLDFKATPQPGKADFLNDAAVPPNGLRGLGSAKAPPNFVPGITFAADVISGRGQTVEYVQNVVSITNGAKDGGAAITRTPGNVDQNILIRPELKVAPHLAAFPLLDGRGVENGAFGNPVAYENTQAGIPGSIATRYTAVDSPAVRSTADKGILVVKIDYDISLNMFLTVIYRDGSIYALGNVNWKSRLYADDWAATTGVRRISDDSRVTATGLSMDNDTPPEKTRGPVYNAAAYKTPE